MTDPADSSEPTEPSDSTDPLDPDDPEERSEEVRALGGNRYLISLEDEEGPGGTEVPDPASPGSGSLDDAAYGFEVTLKGEDGLTREHTASNDVREVFDALVRAYARAVAPDHPPEEVVRTLLSAYADRAAGGRDGSTAER